MAAAAVCLARGVDPDAVRVGLRSFSGVPHRLQEVACRDGVLYVNDSKATNIASTQGRAGRVHGWRLDPSDPRRPGQGPGLHRAARTRSGGAARAVYLIGEDASSIAAALAGADTQVRECGDLERALAAGGEDGRPRGRGPALARLRELRPVHRLRSPRRALSGARRGIEASASRRRSDSRCQQAQHGAFAFRRPVGRRAARRASASRRAASAQRPLEHRILLTATLCLLAFGAVMVYSASSATTLLRGQGNGSGYLIKYVVYGAVGLVAHARARARRRRESRGSITAPLLVASFVLVLAVHVPHVGVSVNGARRWIGPGQLQFQPSELLKLALVLYSATLLARRPQRVHDLRDLANPLLLVVGGACLLVATQPDLGTAMVIAFTTSALLIAAGIPLRRLALLGGWRVGGGLPVRARAAVCPGAPDLFPRSLGARLGQRLPGGAGPDRDRLGRPVRGRPRRVGAEDLLPARRPPPTSSSP